MSSDQCADCANKDLVIAILGGEIQRRETANRELTAKLLTKTEHIRRLKRARRG